MRNEFVLTERSNVIVRKILKSALMVIAIITFVVCLQYLSTGFLYFLLVSAIVFFTLLFSFKSYKVIGQITFETNSILIKKNDLTIQLPFQMIHRIKLIIIGRKRRSYWPVIYQPIGVNMADGTGNLMEIETDDKNYKLDVFLKNSLDENSLEFQIKRIADAGLKIEKRKMPVILGDSI